MAQGGRAHARAADCPHARHGAAARGRARATARRPRRRPVAASRSEVDEHAPSLARRSAHRLPGLD